MYVFLFYALACLSTCHGLTEEDEKKDNPCNVLQQLFESSAVSVDIKKNGFHRELVMSVELSHDDLRGVRVLLIQQWPRGVYVDPYQLTSLRDHRDWQFLIDSDIDLELPAHKTSGFVTYVYPSPDEPTPRSMKVTIPVHARYHEPAIDGKPFISVEIKPPKLLLWTDKSAQFDSSESHMIVEAPCTHRNSSTCLWLQLHQQQDGGSVSLQVPVGDKSLVTPVCAGTLLITMICCLKLSKYMWIHRIN